MTTTTEEQGVMDMQTQTSDVQNNPSEKIPWQEAPDGKRFCTVDDLVKAGVVPPLPQRPATS